MKKPEADTPFPLADGPSSLFPIRTVATITGVNATTLRAWERRFGLIRPVRTEGGHRLYTQEQVDAIQRVTELLERGIPISQVQHKLKSESHSLQQSAEPGTRAPSDQWQAYQQRMFNAVLRFDAAALDAVYNEALALYPVDLVTRQLIVPLLKRLGERWRTAAGLAPAEYDSIAEEHFFGIYLRNKLGARLHHHPAHRRGPVLVVACLPGEHHEVGLMLFSLAALDFGFNVVLLGANLPLQSLPVPVARTQGAAVVLAGSLALEGHRFCTELAQITRTLQVPVFIGGAVAGRYHDEIVAAQAVPLGIDIPAALKRIAGAIAFEP